MELDLIPFVVEAMGYNKKIYKDVDKLYQTRKFEFYNAARGHKLYNHQIVTEGNLLQEEYCKKSLGILLITQKDNDLQDAVIDIFKKGWPHVITFVNNNSEIDLQKFSVYFFRKSGGIDKLSENEIKTNIFMCFYIAYCARKNVVKNEAYNVLINTLVQGWQHYEETNVHRIFLERAIPEDIDRINQIRFRIGKVKKFSDLYKNNDLAELISFIFDYENISVSSICDSIKLTQKEIDELIYLNVIDGEKIENKVHLTYSMVIRLLIKAYKQVKQHYFANNKETMYVELEGLEKQLKSEKQECARLRNNLDELLNMQGKLLRENQRLKQQLSEAQRNRQELIALREFIFKINNQDEHIVDDVKVDLGFLKTCKAVVVGGHERWQARMKELLPEFTFIHPDQINFDIRLLDGVDIVFVYTNYLNHSIYYRTMNAIEGKNIKIVYLNQQNENIVLNEIQKAFRNMKENMI